MYVYGTCLFCVGCSDSVVVGRNVCCVAAVVKVNVFSLGVLKYDVCLCKGLVCIMWQFSMLHSA